VRLDSTLLDQLALAFAKAAANQVLKCESESRIGPKNENELKARKYGDHDDIDRKYFEIS
jgi:hypothetical protein